MIDLCLRANDADALASACPFLRDEDGWITSGDGWALDPIGPIVTTPGTYDEDGNEIIPPVIDQRFHANLRCSEDISELVPETVLVFPTKPVRVWA